VVGVSPSAIRAGNAAVELSADDSRFTPVMVRAERRFNAVVGAVRRASGVAATTATAALAAMAPAVVRFTSFDDAIRATKAATEATGPEFESLRDRALELGRTTSFTAVEVANLMTELGRGGFKPAEIEQMTKAMLDLARATGTDVVAATKVAAAAFGQFGLKAEDAERIVDLLTATANKSFTDLPGLGESLKHAGPAAHDMGVSLRDTLALVGALGNVGVQGEMAGTSLRRLNAEVPSRSEDLERIFGVASKDLAGNARPLVDVMEDIFEATKNLGTATRAAKFNEFFGLLGITGASAISKNAASVRDLRAALRDVGGYAAKTAAEMDAGLGGAFRRVKGAVEGAAIALGEAMAPALGAVGAVAAVAANRLTELIRDNRTLAVKVGAATLGLLAFAGTAAALAAVGYVVGGVTALFAAGAAAASLAWAALGLAVAAVLAPVGLVAVALGGLGLLFVNAAAAGGRMVERLVRGLDEVLSGLRRVGGVFSDTLNGVVTAVNAGRLNVAWDTALKGLEAGWLTLVELMTSKWFDFCNFFRDVFRDAVLAVQQTGLGIVLSIQTGFLDAVIGVVDQLNRARAAIKGPPDRAERQAAEAKAAPELARLDKERAAVKAAADAEAAKLQAKADEIAKLKASDSPFKGFGIELVEGERKDIQARLAEFGRQLDAIDRKKQQAVERARPGDEFIDTSALRAARDEVENDVKGRMEQLKRLDAQARQARDKGQEEKLDRLRAERDRALADLRALTARAEAPPDARAAAAGGLGGFAGDLAASRLEGNRKARAAGFGGLGLAASDAAFNNRREDDPVAARMAAAGGLAATVSLERKAQMLGESVRGVFQSADYRGTLGIGGAADPGRQTADGVGRLVSLTDEQNKKLDAQARAFGDMAEWLKVGLSYG
jgi:TP901 family phage tail tape measure protein